MELKWKKYLLVILPSIILLMQADWSVEDSNHDSTPSLMAQVDGKVSDHLKEEQEAECKSS